MEKRSFTRILFQAEATLKHNGQVIRGKVENLSLKGMFLRAGERVPISESVEIKIFLSGASSELSIHMTGYVVRHTDDGIALQFREMDLDSFVHLKNVVAYNLSEGDDVMEDFEKMIIRE